MRVTVDATPILGNQTGVGVFTSSLIQGLLDSDEVSLSVFALTVQMRNLKEALPESVPHNQLPMPASLLTRLWQSLEIPKLDWWIKPGSAVHGTNFVAPPTASAQLVTVHDLTCIRYPQMCDAHTLRYPALIAAALKRGAHIHTLSHAVAQDVQENFKVDSDRVHVIASGIPDLAHLERKAGEKKPVAKPYIFAIGTIEPRKDYPTLLRAFDIVADKLDDIQLVIAGSRGWRAEQFDSALANIKHADRVQTLGRISDQTYAELLTSASVLAYPSIYEGFGYPPLQAMQANIPVVATRAGSLPEVCGDAAEFVDPGDTEALSDALVRILTDESLQNDLVLRGQKRLASFQWGEAIPKFVALYRQLAG